MAFLQDHSGSGSVRTAPLCRPPPQACGMCLRHPHSALLAHEANVHSPLTQHPSLLAVLMPCSGLRAPSVLRACACKCCLKQLPCNKSLKHGRVEESEMLEMGQELVSQNSTRPTGMASACIPSAYPVSPRFLNETQEADLPELAFCWLLLLTASPNNCRKWRDQGLPHPISKHCWSTEIWLKQFPCLPKLAPPSTTKYLFYSKTTQKILIRKMK